MADVLVITVPVPAGTYPSVNHTGRGVFKKGRKTDEYHELFNAVKTAAEEEMARIGWETATDYCWTSITRYKSTRRKQDVGNLGKCESDALTAAGVWIDDDRAAPVSLDIEYDPAGPDRVVIIVRRRFVAQNITAMPAPRGAKDAEPRAAGRRGIPYTGGPIPKGYALCGKELIPVADALEMINGAKKRAS